MHIKHDRCESLWGIATVTKRGEFSCRTVNTTLYTNVVYKHCKGFCKLLMHVLHYVQIEVYS